jgi:hypothetical protein
MIGMWKGFGIALGKEDVNGRRKMWKRNRLVPGQVVTTQ